MNWVVISLLLIVTGCKTSGQLARSKNTYQEPVSIKTVENSSQTNSASDENLVREYEMLKGELENQRFKTESEKSQLELKIKDLETKNKSLVEEIQKLRSGQTQPIIDAGTQIPAGKSGAPLLWELALKDLNAGQFEKAVTPLSELIKNYPKDAKTFSATLALAAAHFQLSHYDESVLLFNQAIDKYPKKSDLAFAWFGQGVAFAQMKRAEDSKLFFEELVRRYPKSNEAKLAQKILNKKEKVPSDLVKIGSPRWQQP